MKKVLLTLAALVTLSSGAMAYTYQADDSVELANCVTFPDGKTICRFS
ncbi:hypothetical protein F971_03145 [Acinetobacter vivianii]|uniref:Uncharacterized protein n=1 Tax=Acinetobacter vivianii TaxID=1776742 RepID=N8W9S9_9GAMM|nr:hypothetical protein F971_03145 [Acinetobacter vivianii]